MHNQASKHFITLFIIFVLCSKALYAADIDYEYGESDLHSQIEASKALDRKNGTGGHHHHNRMDSGSDTGGPPGRHHFSEESVRHHFNEEDYPQAIRPLMVQAETYRSNNQLSEALHCYDSAVKQIPDCLPLRIRRGYTLIRQQNFKTAIADFQFVMVKDAKNLQALHGRVRCYEAIGETAKALSDLNQIIGLEPDRGQNYMHRATLYDAMGKTKERDADKAKGGNLIAMRQVVSLVGKGHFVDALSVVNERLKMEPNDRSLQIERAKLLTDLGHVKEAIATYQHVTDNATPEVCYWRGKAYEKDSQLSKAISDYSKAIAGAVPFPKKASTAQDKDNKPALVDYYRERARAYIESDQYALAISDCTAYLPYYPEASGYSLRADANAMSGKLTLALADYKAALKLDPLSQHALLEGAHIAEKLSDYQTAASFYSELINLNPTMGDLWLARAQSYEHLNKLAEAEKDVDKSIQFEPDDALFYESRGHIHASMRNYKEAVEDYTRAIKLEPDSPRLLQKRALIYECLGNTQLALADREAAEHKKTKP